MPTLLELREQRASIWAQAQEFNDRSERGEDLSVEDRTAWDRALAEIDELRSEITRRETTVALDAAFAGIDERTGRPADGGDLRGAIGGTDTDKGDQYREAFEAYLRAGIAEVAPEQRELLQANFRAQGTATGSAGGYTVPEGFWAKVTETMKYYGGVLNVVEIINTSTGAPLPWPTNDDTANKGAILTENTQISEQDVTFGQKQLGAYTYTSKLIRVAIQLLQDSGIDIESFVARKIGERLGRIHNEHFTTGTGTNQPQGFITGATVGKTAASTTAFTIDELIDLEHSVDVAYRNNGSFQLHDLVLAELRKKKDSNGQYLWQPGVQAGQPDRIHNRPYTVNNDMASTLAASAKPVAFGDFRAAYVVRIAREMQLMRLAERYADYLQVGFFGFDRADGLVQDASAVKVLALAAS